MTRLLAIFFMVSAMTACTSRITGLGTVFPDIEGMQAMLFGDQAARAEALSHARAGLAARLCARYVFDGLEWTRAASKANAVKGGRPLFHGELFPETVWSFRNVPLVFFWPLPKRRGCMIAVFSGDREASVKAIVSEIGLKIAKEPLEVAGYSLDVLTFARLKDTRMLPTLIASGSGAYFVSASIADVDDPFATSGSGFLFSMWQQDFVRAEADG